MAKKLRRCPFCNSKLLLEGAAADFKRNDIMNKWMLFHTCLHDGNFKNGVTVCIYGDTEKEVIDKWNGDAK